MPTIAGVDGSDKVYLVIGGTVIGGTVIGGTVIGGRDGLTRFLEHVGPDLARFGGRVGPVRTLTALAGSFTPGDAVVVEFVDAVSAASWFDAVHSAPGRGGPDPDWTGWCWLLEPARPTAHPRHRST